MSRTTLCALALLGMLSSPPGIHAQISGETRESARPLSEEGVPRRQNAPLPAPSPPPDGTVGVMPSMPAPAPGAASVRWVIGSGARLEEAATGFGVNTTMVMTGVTRFELRGEYTRRDPDGLDGIDGVAGQLKLFLPSTWSPPGVSIAGSADGGWEFDVGRTWAVKGAADVNLTDHVLVGFTGGYHEKQPEEGATASGFVPAGSLTLIPITGTEVSLQYRLDNDYHGEDRTELAVSRRFLLPRDRSIIVRGSVAKHGTLSIGLSYRP